MGYPNVPPGVTDLERRFSAAINYLLNRLNYNHWVFDGQPDAGEVWILTQFPIATTISASSCGGWVPLASVPTSDAVISFYTDGVLSGTVTWAAGEQVAVVNIIDPLIPADTDFSIVAPDPQDATFADFTLIFATSN